MPVLAENRYRILRRVVQASVLVLFIGGNAWGWKVLQGNLSSSLLLGAVPLVDPYALLQVLATGTMAAAEALLGGGIVLLFFAVLGGRAFCGWICPVNAVTDLADLASSAAGTRSPGLRMSRNARYWALGASFILSAAFGIAAFEWISPIGALHRGVVYGMGTGWMAVAAVFLFDVFAVRNGFCGHLCPLGAFYALVGRASAVRVLHSKETCTRCMRCIEACPEPQVLPMVGKRDGAVVSGECTNCGRCIEVCPDKAMRFGLRTYGQGTRDTKEGTP